MGEHISTLALTTFFCFFTFGGLRLLLQLLLESLELSDGDGVSGVDTESMSHSGVGSHGRPLNGRRVSPNIIATSSLRLTSTHRDIPGSVITCTN